MVSTSTSSTNILISTLIVGLIVPCLFRNVNAVTCFKCETQSGCTEKSAPSPAVTADNCGNPTAMVNGWIESLGLTKIGIGSVNLQAALNLAASTITDNANIKNKTVCSFFIATSENAVTKAIDGSISKVRSVVGDKDAKKSLTIKKWVMRDCTVLQVLPDTSDETFNRCVPLAQETRHIAKLHFCTCSHDQCNENVAKLKEVITHPESLEGLIAHDDDHSKAHLITVSYYTLALMTLCTAFSLLIHYLTNSTNCT